MKNSFRKSLGAQVEDAQERYVAIEHARALVEEARVVLQKSGIHNHKVLDSILTAQIELARFKRSMKYAITKRQERMKKCRPSIN